MDGGLGVSAVGRQGLRQQGEAAGWGFMGLLKLLLHLLVQCLLQETCCAHNMDMVGCLVL